MSRLAAQQVAYQSNGYRLGVARTGSTKRPSRTTGDEMVPNPRLPGYAGPWISRPRVVSRSIARGDSPWPGRALLPDPIGRREYRARRFQRVRTATGDAPQGDVARDEASKQADGTHRLTSAQTSGRAAIEPSHSDRYMSLSRRRSRQSGRADEAVSPTASLCPSGGGPPSAFH